MSLVKIRKEALPYRSGTKQVLVEMWKLDGKTTPAIVAQRLNRNYFAVQGSMVTLVEKGRADRVGRGVYRLTDKGMAEASNLRGSVPPPGAGSHGHEGRGVSYGRARVPGPADREGRDRLDAGVRQACVRDRKGKTMTA